LRERYLPDALAADQNAELFTITPSSSEKYLGSQELGYTDSDDPREQR